MRHGSGPFGPILSKPLTGLSGGCIQPGVGYSSVRKTACDPVLDLCLDSGCGRHPPRVVIRGRPATCACRSEHNIPYRPACNQTGSDPGIRLRGDLPKSRARLLDWCANPPGDRRESGRPPTCSELACCVRRPPRVVIVGFGTLLVSQLEDGPQLVQS